MIFALIVFGIIILFLLLVMYFFSVAFVKHNIGNTDDLNDSLNKPLQKYRDIVKHGMNYIESADYKWVETVSFDGLRLKARYFDNGSENTILLFHGYRSSAKRDFSCAVEMYSDFGLNVLLCDQRSHGESQGRLITFGVKESRDVVSWIEFVTENYNPEKLLLGGISMGATTVILACGHNLPKSVKAVVADCGFTSPSDIMKKVAKQSFKINAGFFLPFLDMACRIIGKFSFIDVSIEKTLKKSSIPVLFIHGTSDGFVPCEMSERGYKSAPEGSELLLVPEADHGLSFLVDSAKVKGAVGEFLKNNL